MSASLATNTIFVQPDSDALYCYMTEQDCKHCTLNQLETIGPFCQNNCPVYSLIQGHHIEARDYTRKMVTEDSVFKMALKKSNQHYWRRFR